MKARRRDDAGGRKAAAGEAGPAVLSPASTGPMSIPASLTSTPEAIGRHSFVLGVFADPAGADGATARLAAGRTGACDVLVVSEAAPGRATLAAIERGARVSVHHIDQASLLAPRLAEALRRTRPFAALGGSTAPKRADAPAPPGLERLLQNLVHHLEGGAAVVIVQAPDSEQQLLVSRALLDAKCDTLLTHEVLETPGGAPSTESHSEGRCCEGCTTKSCRQLDPP